MHRGAAENFDESADLTVLSRTPVTVVSAGVKSILDIPATLERLETLSVAVVGYRTSRFPAFWLSDSGYDLDGEVVHITKAITAIIFYKRRITYGLRFALLTKLSHREINKLRPCQD